MKDSIKDYLKRQFEISKELNEILVAINSIEDKEIDKLYQENEKLVTQLNEVNQDNISETEDRLYTLKKRVEEQLLRDDTKNDIEFKRNLVYLKSEIIQLSSRVNDIKEQLSQMSEKHDDYMKKVNSNIPLDSDIVNEETSDKEIVDKENISNEVLDKLDKCTGVEINDTEEEKLEFKIGSNVLNILGVVLILISFITFGNYIYTNYMTNTLKGIFLFGISSVILLLGEKFFSKKIPKFAIGISALGVGSLYVSMIINYLVLQTINSIVVIILTLIITSISIFISEKHNSNIIRIIGLFGSYGCLIPLQRLNVMQSYITVLILLIINIANLYIPIKDNKFLIYSSIFNVIFGGVLISNAFLVESSIIVCFIFTILFNNIMYIKQITKIENLKMYRFVALLSTWCMMSQLLCNSIHDMLGIGLILIAVSAISYFKSSKELKGIFYIHGLIVGLILINPNSDIFEYNTYSILFVGLTVLTMYTLSKLKDNYLKVATVILLTSGMIDFIGNDSMIIRAVYGALFTISIWVLSGKNKNGLSTLVLKHAFFGSVLLIIFYNIDFDISSNLICLTIVSMIYVLLLTNVERLRDKNYKVANKIILITSLIFLNLYGYERLYTAILSLAISGIILVMLNMSKYVESKFMNKHSVLIYSLYITYAVFVFLNSMIIDDNITNLIFSVVLMIIAFANVWIGFKLDILEVRRYGLVLSLLVCAKVIFFDFYYYSFVIKTGLFLITGIVALLISYIYSKLEQELKIKSNSQDEESEK